MKKLFYITVLLLSAAAQAQNESNIWYFGFFGGLDFNGGEPVPLSDGQINTGEGSSSIADGDGNLLFYTDGVTVHNKEHDVMQNGFGLMGHTSSTQSALIVGRPGSTSTCYIFTVGAAEDPNGLNYSEVDMSANGGLGAVTAVKNVNLIDNTTEGLTATLHENGEDIWVVVHSATGNAVYSYLITDDGLNEEPVISNAGPVFESEFDLINDGAGSMKLSPDGSRLAMASLGKGLILFDFDKTSGTVSNARQLEEGPDDHYGVEFSPSGNVLYCTVPEAIVQYDLLADDIPGSATVLLGEWFMSYSSLQLAPNGKIYRAQVLQDYLGVIHNPDIVGPGCNAVIQGLFLGEGSFNYLGLPNAITALMVKPGFEAVSLCFNSPTEFTFNWNRVPDTVTWDFGDGTTSSEVNPEHIYIQAGTYTVQLTVEKSGGVWVSEQEIVITEDPEFNLGGPYVTCDAANITIAVNPQNFVLANASYSWQLNGEPLAEQDSSIQATDFGTYEVTVSVNGCTHTESVTVSRDTDAVAVSIFGGCEGMVYRLSALPVGETFNSDEVAIKWEGPDGFTADTENITVQLPGSYTVTVTTEEGCTATGTFEVAGTACFIPRGISPNNDGLNDSFDLSEMQVSSLVIFNRYGVEVYALQDYRNEWQGQSSNGGSLPDGTYFYSIALQDADSRTGWVYINRETK